MKQVAPDLHRPEKNAFARGLLIALAAMGAVVILPEYRHGNLAVAGLAAFSILFGPTILYLSRHPARARLPERAALMAMLLFLLVGGLTQLQQPEKMVWVVILPVAFFFLSDLRTGMAISLFGFVWHVSAYLAYPMLWNEPRMGIYAFGQAMGAYVLAAGVAGLYERVRARQEAQLRETANLDFLTGAPNRRGLLVFASVIREQSRRSGHSIGLILFDLDDFKQVNDSLGHDAGDALLREVVDVARSRIRRSDILARWGGEEFLILLPECRLEDAKHLAEKIRAAVASHAFRHRQNVTVSFGVTESPAGEDWEEAVSRADKALYQAKSNGKNRYEVLPAPLVPQAA